MTREQADRIHERNLLLLAALLAAYPVWWLDGVMNGFIVPAEIA